MSPTNLRPSLLLATMLLLAPLPIGAEVKVEVFTRCEVAGMKSHYQSYLSNILDQLRSNLKESLEKRDRLKYWTFALDGTSRREGRGKGIQLLFIVTEPQVNELTLKILLRSTRTLDMEVGKGVWLKPGAVEADGYPLPEHAAPNLTRAFNALLDSNLDRLRELLEDYVPLATGGHWSKAANDLKIVLPLPWARYQALSQSIFRLGCTWSRDAARTEVELFSDGLNKPGMYEDVKPSYQAIEVAPRQWRELPGTPQSIEKIRNRARKLHPRLAYLQEEVEPDLGLEIYREESR